MLMTCRHATRRVTDAREGALSPFARARYRLHLLLCPHCRAYVRGFEQVVDLLPSLVAEAPPAGLCASLEARLAARTRGADDG